LGPVDDTHAARPEDTQDTIGADGFRMTIGLPIPRRSTRQRGGGHGGQIAGVLPIGHGLSSFMVPILLSPQALCNTNPSIFTITPEERNARPSVAAGFSLRRLKPSFPEML